MSLDVLTKNYFYNAICSYLFFGGVIDFFRLQQEDKIVQPNGYGGGGSGSHCKEDVNKSEGNDVKHISNQVTMCSVSDSNGNAFCPI